MKNATKTVPTTPNLDVFCASFLGFSPRKVQRPKPMKESEAASEIISIGTTAVRSWPITTVMAKHATVAKKTAKSTFNGLYRVAKDIAKNWVLSPISAKTIRPKDARKAAKLKFNKALHR